MAILSLKNSKEFNIVNKHGVKKHGAYLLVVLATNFTHIPSSSPDSTFFGMKVSKKLSKKAVVRNKIKRNIRHLVRNLIKEESINTDNKAFIVIPKKSFKNTSFAKLTTDFCNIFKKNIS